MVVNLRFFDQPEPGRLPADFQREIDTGADISILAAAAVEAAA